MASAITRISIARILTPWRDSTAAVALTLIALTEAGRDELELAQDPVILLFTDFF